MSIEPGSLTEDLVKKIDSMIHFGLQNYSISFVERRLRGRFMKLKVETYEEYLKILAIQKDEREALFDELLVNVTHFYRDETTFKKLFDDVIPKIVEHAKGRLIKVWCAGCSTGEEPYTVAILFLEYIKKSGEKFSFEIKASDMDKNAIDKAIKGYYDIRQFKEMPENLTKNYFEKISDELFQVNDEVKKHVTFDVSDVFKKDLTQNLDLILCRNTVIYFNSRKEELYLKFYDFLKENGFLVLGRSEIMIGPAKMKFKNYDIHEHIYIKN